MMDNSKLIVEQAIFSEAKVVKQTPTKAIFRCPIQTCDEINQNRRMYPRNVLEESMFNCRDRMQRRAFYSELDHPFPSGNPATDAVRQSTVSLKEVSHIVRNYDFNGNVLIGEMETTSTHNGKILFGLLRDKTGIGFSLRGMAELEQAQDHNIVKSPMTTIAYDAVSNPSHKAAVVDFNEMTFEQSMLFESKKSGVVCANGRCFMPDYFDKLIESKVFNFFERWI